MFAGSDAPWHWLILGVIVVALFGHKKLPDAARALGRSMRIFKTEIKGLTSDDSARETDNAAESKPTPRPKPALRTSATSPAPTSRVPVAAQPAARRDALPVTVTARPVQ